MSFDLYLLYRRYAKVALLVCFIGIKIALDSGSLLELSCFETGKLEANLEVSIMELYYIAKKVLREHEKGIVCKKGCE